MMNAMEFNRILNKYTTQIVSLVELSELKKSEKISFIGLYCTAVTCYEIYKGDNTGNYCVVRG